MGQQKEYGLSIVRLVSMIMIILCHIMQYEGNEACYYLNVGVGIFLFISGYLYGNKEILDVKDFLKKRLIRILPPYYLMLAIIILVNCLKGETISVKGLISSFMALQWYGHIVPNCGHLWYISCILFCYMITPILQWWHGQNEGKTLHRRAMQLGVAVVILQATYSLGGMKQTTTTILPYILGYIFAANRIPQKITKNVRGGVYSGMLIAAVGLYLVMYAVETFGHFRIPGIIKEYYKCVVAMAVTVLLVNWNIKGAFARRLLDFTDKYSYGIYLTHHIFILGSLSVMTLTHRVFVNGLLAFVFAILSGVALILFSEKLTHLLVKRSQL